jgi:hypothetical protein
MPLLPSLALALSFVAPPPAPLAAPALKHKLTGHTGTVRGAAFSPDGTTLATVGDDGRLNVWEVSSGKAVISTRGGGFGSVEYSSDGKRLLTAGTDRVVRLWDAGTGKELKAFNGHTGQLYVACFTPDNKHIVSCGIDNLTRIWDVVTGKEVRTLPSGTSYALAVSPDGKYVITGSPANTLTLWETSTGKQVRQMTGHTNVVVWLAFSPDGRTVASASYDQSIRLWETSTGKRRLHIQAARNSPRVLMFSRDGRFLAEGNYDFGARIFDSGTGKELFHDASIRQSLYAIALSRDGWYLCGGGGGGNLLLWDVSAVTRRRVPAGEMTAATFADHWRALGSEDAEQAYRAIAALAVPGAVKHLRPRVQPPRPADPAALKRAPRLLRDLESEDDDTWRKAADQLAGLGPAILPTLKAALEKAEDPDVKLRLIVTMRRADVSGSDELRLPRLIEALERLRSPGAVKLLEGLARGWRGKAAASEAKVTLARLRARSVRK